MKRTNPKISRRKNPPKFLTEIENLVGSDVMATISSENGLFLIEGLLHKLDANFYFVKTPFYKRKYSGEVSFSLDLVDDVVGRNIHSFVKKNIQLRSIGNFSGYKTFNEIVPYIGKPAHISVNTSLYGIVAPPSVHGVLKFNTKTKLFYVQNAYNIFVRFRLESISGARVFEEVSNTEIYINI